MTVQTSWDSVGFHMADAFGSIPKSAILQSENRQAERRTKIEFLFSVVYRGWASAQSGLISQTCRVRPPDPQFGKRKTSHFKQSVMSPGLKTVLPDAGKQLLN